ncbi:hypothetical protein [Bacteroides graminisolvens]|uniref:hypothetical protein n=1 Tax=Bacteroides graminisolvens TaxID=477666 RepID=UPI0023F0392B|nr:hypothetical protein [Bacteroides graminisolvens]
MIALFKNCILVIIPVFFISCRNNIVEYEVGISDNNSIVQLKSWHILGPIKNSDPILHSHFLDKNHLDMLGVSDSLFCRDPFSLEMDIPQILQVGNTFFNDIYHSKCQLPFFGTSCCCEIHLWDWDGNPVARLMFNKNVTCFAVSQDDSYIVLYSSLDEGTLYKTDIPTLKDSQ